MRFLLALGLLAVFSLTLFGTGAQEPDDYRKPLADLVAQWVRLTEQDDVDVDRKNDLEERMLDLASSVMETNARSVPDELLEGLFLDVLEEFHPEEGSIFMWRMVERAEAEAAERMSYSLLSFRIIDTDGYSLPGVTCLLAPDNSFATMPREEVFSEGGFVAITGADGLAMVVARVGATLTLEVSLDGFATRRITGIEVAADQHYRLPALTLEVGNQATVPVNWDLLLVEGMEQDPGYAEDWLEEQPEAVKELILRPQHVRIVPLPRRLRGLLHIRVTESEWEEIRGASVVVRDEAGMARTAADENGNCQIVLDHTGLYTIEIELLNRVPVRVTQAPLKVGRLYRLDVELELAEGNGASPQSLAWRTLVADEEVWASGFLGEEIDLQRE